MSEDLNQRLEQSSHGNLQTKPDERRRFLGSLRERTFLRMTVAQVQDPKWQKIFIEHFNEFKPYSIIINGKMPQNGFIGQVMALCSKNDVKFTMINDTTAQNDPDATGLLVVSPTAINRMRIEINQVFAPSIGGEGLAAPKPHKKSLLERLFGKK